ncbi:rhomboid family intramembrane serine protease [Tessaracoccus terricola]
MGVLLAIMWVLEVFDQATGNSLDPLGIVPRQLDSLDNILVAPWLHFGWVHLIGNSGPFMVLGVLTYLAGLVRWLVTTAASILGSGLLVWLIAPVNTVTAGASGLIFGWLAYLLIRGLFTRRAGQIALGVVLLLVYGGILVGLLPTAAGVSWQGHLGGAIGGGLAAWWQHRRGRRDSTTTA